MNRTAALLAVTVAAVGVAAPHAIAAPKKKPITKSYSTVTVTPDPTNFSPEAKYSVCEQAVPGSFHDETFKVPAKGTLKVELTGYLGDHDLLLLDGAREEIAFSGLTAVQGEPEVIELPFKKATTVHIINCNWGGAPQAKVSYTFTFK